MSRIIKYLKEEASIFGCAIIGCLTALAALFLYPWLVMLLWNFLAKNVFTFLPILTFWETFAMLILVTLLASIIHSKP